MSVRKNQVKPGEKFARAIHQPEVSGILNRIRVLFQKEEASFVLFCGIQCPFPMALLHIVGSFGKSCLNLFACILCGPSSMIEVTVCQDNVGDFFGMNLMLSE